MRVHLCRHATAAPGAPDDLRALTAGGIAAAENLGRLLAAATDRPLLILTSPLVRAHQTAEIVGAILEVPVLVDTRLAPGAGVDSLRAMLVSIDGPVATVGHQPDCSQIAEALTGVAPIFPPAGCVALELDTAGTQA